MEVHLKKYWISRTADDGLWRKNSNQLAHAICDSSVINSLTLRCVKERSRPYLNDAEPVLLSQTSQEIAHQKANETSEPSTTVNVMEAGGLLDYQHGSQNPSGSGPISP